MAHICLHVIQSFPPNNLNRDDTGAPKDCIFGGVRRARVSSQAWKRSIRMAFHDDDALHGHLATRTRRLQEHLAKAFRERHLDPSSAMDLAAAVVDALEVERNRNKPDESAVLLFITDAETEALIDWALAHQEPLLATHPAAAPPEQAPGGPRGRQRKATGGKDWESLCKEARHQLTSPRSVDTALFGRMLAEIDGAGIEAAASVAHAISTHAVQMEEDYFTAVDDLKQLSEDTDQGSGMIGEVLYQSAVLYRFAAIDTDQLLRGLGDGDQVTDLARTALATFTRAFLTALPSGKQTTFAAYNLPSAVLVTHDTQPISLANAFLAPVTPAAGERIDARSWAALAAEWTALAEFSAATSPVAVAALDTLGDAAGLLPGVRRTTLTELPDAVAALLDNPPPVAS